MRRIIGLETEYGLRARRNGRILGPDEAGQTLFVPLARSRGATSAFLPGGGRLYLDVGSHPEYATPECTSAADAVTADRAGDEVILSLAQRAVEAERAAGHDTQFEIYRNNVDGAGNTWGSHENYLVGRSMDPDRLAAWLVPFLASRQLIAGAGRWRRGRFTLSQRCEVLGDVMSGSTTRSRPLINTRDEPHADPERFRRLHVLVGDTNVSEQTTWLKLVATELVLRAAETGRRPPVTLADPLAALREWGSDPAHATDAGDAWAVQHAFLGATKHLADTEESKAGWELWAATLEATAFGSAGAAEWVHKLRLLEAWRDRHGWADSDPRLDALDLNYHQVGTDSAGRTLGAGRLLEERGLLPRFSTPEAVRSALQEAPSPTRARIRGRAVEAANANERDVSFDWAEIVVHDLPDGSGRSTTARLRLDDPFTSSDRDADALIGRLRQEPPGRTLGGFVAPT